MYDILLPHVWRYHELYSYIHKTPRLKQVETALAEVGKPWRPVDPRANKYQRVFSLSSESHLYIYLFVLFISFFQFYLLL